jgi:hypothetical protein
MCSQYVRKLVVKDVVGLNYTNAVLKNEKVFTQVSGVSPGFTFR